MTKYGQLLHRLAVVPLAVGLLAGSANAQRTPLVPSTFGAGGPDNASVDAVLTALYGTISADSGVARNWDRFRGLFHPAARMFQVTRAARPGRGPLLFGVEEYVTRNGPALSAGGFHEIEVHRERVGMGRLVHVFSTYESRRAASDPAPFDRGINSIQLLSDGTHWWILNIGWVSETADEPIPARYRAPK
jgi:hypothetical protein